MRKHHKMHKYSIVSDLNNVSRLFKKITVVNRIKTSMEHLQHIEQRRIITGLCT